MTGYAVWHNRRHAPKGHLFQNRYIISEITTEEVLTIALSFADMLERITNFIRILEEKQLELGVGITEVSDIPNVSEEIDSMIVKKHVNSILAQKIKQMRHPTSSSSGHV